MGKVPLTKCKQARFVVDDLPRGADEQDEEDVEDTDARVLAILQRGQDQTKTETFLHAVFRPESVREAQ